MRTLARVITVAVLAHLLTVSLGACMAVILGPCLLCGPARAEEPKPPKIKKGKFQEIKPQIKALLPLAVVNGNLCLDRKPYDQPAKAENEDNTGRIDGNVVVLAGGRVGARITVTSGRGGGTDGAVKAFLALESHAGSVRRTGGGGSSSTGWAREFDGSELEGRLVVQEKQLLISLKEINAPQRSISVTDSGDGVFRMVIMDAAGDTLLVVQSSKGRFRLVQVDQDLAKAVTAGSFAEFYRQNRNFVDGWLMPQLDGLGIGVPALQYSPRVKAAVLSELRGAVTKEEQAAVEQLIACLGGDSFAQREEAGRQLAEKLDRYRPLLEKAAADQKLPAEASDRLKKLLASAGAPDSAAALVQELKLTQDLAYLVEMMQGLPAPERQVVGNRLGELSGQKHGGDAEAWKTWLAQQPKAAAAPAK